MTVKTRFDGKQILIPSALTGHAPCDVEITFVEPAQKNHGHSIWDVVARANGTRNSQEIIDEVSQERDRWDKDQ